MARSISDFLLQQQILELDDSKKERKKVSACFYTRKSKKKNSSIRQNECVLDFAVTRHGKCDNFAWRQKHGTTESSAKGDNLTVYNISQQNIYYFIHFNFNAKINEN